MAAVPTATYFDEYDPATAFPVEPSEPPKTWAITGTGRGHLAEAHALVRGALLSRSMLLHLRQKLHRKSRSELEAVVKGALVRVHPPEDHNYLILQVTGIDDRGTAYSFPPDSPTDTETRRLRLVGYQPAELHAYSFCELSDTSPKDAELAQACEWLNSQPGSCAALKSKADKITAAAAA